MHCAFLAYTLILFLLTSGRPWAASQVGLFAKDHALDLCSGPLGAVVGAAGRCFTHVRAQQTPLLLPLSSGSSPAFQELPFSVTLRISCISLFGRLSLRISCPPLSASFLFFAPLSSLSSLPFTTGTQHSVHCQLCCSQQCSSILCTAKFNCFTLYTYLGESC